MTSRTLLAVLALLMALSCSQSDDVVPVNPSIFDSASSFRASLVVEIVNSNGEPLSDVVVSLGQASVTSDQNGHAVMTNVLMGSSSYVIASHDEYFHGSRRFYPTPGALHNVRIELLERNLAGIINTLDGGEVEIDNEVTLSFPPNAISFEDGSPYSGIVGIRGHALPADRAGTFDMMPGDLVGQLEGGEITGLETFGMVAVELIGENGEQLQVAEGASVEMTVSVPDALRDFAPGTIPLWYFDEISGLWKEEGSAVLTQDGYVGTVSHFTFWNCDLPYDPVKWGAQFVFESGPPSIPLKVCITILESGRTFCSSTNSEGIVCGLVSSESDLRMEVYNTCDELIYESNIGPYYDSTMIGPITLPEQSLELTRVSGTVINCDGAVVEDAFITVIYDGNYEFVQAAEDGSFSFVLPTSCISGPISMSLFDPGQPASSGQISIAKEPIVELGLITVCGTSPDAFFTVEYGDTLSLLWEERVDASAAIGIALWAISAYSTDTTDFDDYARLELEGIGVGGLHENVVMEISFEDSGAVTKANGQVDVVFTEFGVLLGQLVEGSYSGTLVQERDSTQVDVEGSFRLILGG